MMSGATSGAGGGMNAGLAASLNQHVSQSGLGGPAAGSMAYQQPLYSADMYQQAMQHSQMFDGSGAGKYTVNNNYVFPYQGETYVWFLPIPSVFLSLLLLP
eukprot:GHVT01090688.1.p1 GENE.GHVT01090688.1~~GHVT01090688.1.p1  ORF type:complete len:101 (-),score=5.61 GHVT01090688.1:611-913(-)